MPASWEKLPKPLPTLQWLVVLVLIAHFLLTQEPLGVYHILFLLALLGGNLILLYGLPKWVQRPTVVTLLLVVDIILAPSTLYITGAVRTDLLVGYFVVILIAGTAGTLRRVVLLASMTCVAYAGFTLLSLQDEQQLGMTLLRLPFLLTTALIYGAFAEFAKRVQAASEELADAIGDEELPSTSNRRRLVGTLAEQLQDAKQLGTPLSCLIADLDHLEDINETYGEGMGDLVLREFTTVLATESRGYDLAGRMGSDEFLWILPRAEREGAVAAAERLREAVQRYQFGGGKVPLRVTTSIGLTSYLPVEMAMVTPDEMLKAADEGLYHAKEHGRNRSHHQPLTNGRSGAADGGAWDPVNVASRS